MKPQRMSIESEIFDEFRKKLNAMLEMTLREMIRRRMGSGSVSAKISIELAEGTDAETGEMVYEPELKPTVSMKIGSQGKTVCQKKAGFLMKSDGAGGFIVGTNQITMDELIGKGGAA